MNKLYYIQTNCQQPHANLALEMALFKALQPNEVVLYLWQNANTIVIGKNQNVWKECNLKAMKEDKVTLARRNSGGGAVYHDLGNLCFTFLAPDDLFSIPTQSEIIVKAIRKLGIEAYVSGRNDLLIDGKKFSGNAFYHHGGYSYHHGTILFDVNIPLMQKYLTVDEKKLNARGVDSIRARVINLKELNPKITIPFLIQCLKESAEEVYSLKALNDFPYDKKVKEEYEAIYSSKNWLYGNKEGFDYQFSERFSWGDIQFALKVKEKRIEDCIIYSDAMDSDWISDIAKEIKNISFESKEIYRVINKFRDSEMKEDILSLLSRQDF